MSAIPRRPASVAIDGERIRQIREQKELTQLYIAEVVGVSVDTVSRWENNRTPSVRADNVRALAAALEVNPGEISGSADTAPPPRSRRRWVVAAALAAALLCAAAGVWWLRNGAAPQVQATRRLPAYTAPGTAVPVVVRARVVSGEVPRVVLREQLPKGWEFVGAAPPPDQGPGTDGALRWILPVTDGRAAVAYVVRAPPGGAESSAYRFAGQVVTPGKAGRHVAVKGEQRIDLEFIHWADEDGDFQVGDAEVLDALERLEAAPGLGLDSDDLRALWGAPEYLWDPQTREFRVPR